MSTPTSTEKTGYRYSQIDSPMESSMISPQIPTGVPVARSVYQRLPSIRWPVGLIYVLIGASVPAAFAVAIIAYCLAHRWGRGWDGGYITIIEAKDKDGEARLVLLIISSYASTIISSLGIALLPLIAYRAAKTWLRDSSAPDSSRGDGPSAYPSPLQYGFGLGLLGMNGVGSTWNGLRYLARAHKRTPTFLKEVLFYSTSILLLGHAIGLADLWLHSQILAASPPRVAPVPAEEAGPSMFGVELNHAFCLQPECSGSIANYSGYMASVYVNATLTEQPEFANAAALVGTQNVTALFPGSVLYDGSYTLTVPTIAARVQCTTLISACAGAVDQGTGAGCIIPSGYDCCSGGNSTSWYSFGSWGEPLDSNGIMRTDYVPSADKLVVSLVSNVEETADQDGEVNPITSPPGDTSSAVGVFVRSGSVLTVNLLPAVCDMTFYNATIRLSSNSTNVEAETMDVLSAETSSLLVNMGYAPVRPTAWDMAEAVYNGAGSIEDTMLALNEALGRRMLMSLVSAGLLTKAPILYLERSDDLIVGNYPIAPLAIVVLLLLIFSWLALFLFIASQPARGMDGLALEQAQVWMTSPMPLIAAAYPDRSKELEAIRTWSSGSLAMVPDDPSTAPLLRLEVVGEGGAKKVSLQVV